MKRRLLLCCLGLVALCAWAKPTPPVLTPIPPLNERLLVDQTGSIDDYQAISLTSRLRSFPRDERGQVAILLVPELRGETLEQYSLRVAEVWRLGRARHDDGLLIVVLPSLPAARLEVGYGLEGSIPDALAARWLDELLPLIREGRTVDGLVRLLDHIDGVLPPAKEKFNPD